MSDISDIFDELDNIEYNEYNSEVAEAFKKDIEKILYELIHTENLREEFTSENNEKIHFNKHCIGKNINRKSTNSNIYYDFKNIDSYRQYEKFISNEIRHSRYFITSLLDYRLICKYIRKLFEGGTTVTFTQKCELKNKTGIMSISFHSFATNVTENYRKYNTIDLCIQGEDDRTITLFAVDARYLEKIFNKLINKYSDYVGEYISFNR